MFSDTPSAYRSRHPGGKKNYSLQKHFNLGQRMPAYLRKPSSISLLSGMVILTIFGFGFYISSIIVGSENTGNNSNNGQPHPYQSSYIQVENQVKYLRGRIEKMEKESFDKIENLIAKHQEQLDPEKHPLPC